jgi:hypothetical protein
MLAYQTASPIEEMELVSDRLSWDRIPVGSTTAGAYPRRRN